MTTERRQTGSCRRGRTFGVMAYDEYDEDSIVLARNVCSLPFSSAAVLGHIGNMRLIDKTWLKRTEPRRNSLQVHVQSVPHMKQISRESCIQSSEQLCVSYAQTRESPPIPRSMGRTRSTRAAPSKPTGFVESIGQSKLRLEKYDEALEFYKRALCGLQFQRERHDLALTEKKCKLLALTPASPSSRQLDETKLSMAETHLLIGDVYAKKGLLHESLNEINVALGIQESMLVKHHLHVAHTLQKRALVQKQLGQLRECIRSMQDAIHAAQRSQKQKRNKEASLRLARLGVVLGTIYYEHKRYEKAAQIYSKSWKVFVSLAMTSSRHPEVATLRRRLCDPNIYAKTVMHYWDDSSGI